MDASVAKLQLLPIQNSVVLAKMRNCVDLPEEIYLGLNLSW